MKIFPFEFEEKIVSSLKDIQEIFKTLTELKQDIEQLKSQVADLIAKKNGK